MVGRGGDDMSECILCNVYYCVEKSILIQIACLATPWMPGHIIHFFFSLALRSFWTELFFFYPVCPSIRLFIHLSVCFVLCLLMVIAMPLPLLSLLLLFYFVLGCVLYSVSFQLQFFGITKFLKMIMWGWLFQVIVWISVSSALMYAWTVSTMLLCALYSWSCNDPKNEVHDVAMVEGGWYCKRTWAKATHHVHILFWGHKLKCLLTCQLWALHL